MWRLVLAVLAALIAFGVSLPYAFDIKRGRVKPARSTRGMFLILLLISLSQQLATGSSWALAVTIGDTACAILLLWLGLRYGVGGLRRIDVICYGLLLIDLLVWLTTKNAALALHLTIIADLIAFWPTLHKTWYDPHSETAYFYWGTVVAAVLSIIASPKLSYGILLFPAYLLVANFVEILIIYLRPAKAEGTA